MIDLRAAMEGTASPEYGLAATTGTWGPGTDPL